LIYKMSRMTTAEYDVFPKYARGDDVHFLRKKLEDYLAKNNFKVNGDEIRFGRYLSLVGKIKGEWCEKVSVIFGSRGAEKLRRALEAYKLPEESELADRRTG